MKFSMCTAVYGMNDLHDTIDRAAMHGFDAVELTAALHMPVSSPQQYCREVRGWIREAGLACSALHYIFDGSVKLATADRELNAACAAYLRRVIDVAADMEAETVIIGSGGTTRSIDPGADRREAARCMADVIHQTGEYASGKGVYLAVEAINRYETNFLNTMAEATEFMKLVDHPNVRTMADTYHINIEEADPVEAVRTYGWALQNLHLADSNRYAPGAGHIDFRAIAQALLETGFRHYCSFEVFGLYPWKLWFDTVEEADSQMRLGIATARAAFGQ